MGDFDRLMKGVKIPTHDWDKPDDLIEYEADAVDSMQISSTLELEELESVTFDYCGPSNWIKYRSV